MRRILCALLLLVAAPGALAALESFEKDELVIETAEGERHVFEVELALTSAQQSQGLMYRQSMAADAGMLFVYDPPRRVGMWMRNTVLPLDMLFVDEAGRIVKIVERTVPFSHKTIAADEPVQGVLELNGGTTARLGIHEGDRLLHPSFDPDGSG